MSETLSSNGTSPWMYVDPSWSCTDEKQARDKSPTKAAALSSNESSAKPSRQRRQRVNGLIDAEDLNLLVDLAVKQRWDDNIIKAQLIEGEVDYRRKRSLKFREKRQAWRQKIFDDPFHKLDRSQKNVNKAVAAKRRKRDIHGKFNFEEKHFQRH